MNLKHVLTWAGVAFITWYAVQDPAGLAHFTDSIARIMSSFAAGLQHFVAQI